MERDTGDHSNSMLTGCLAGRYPECTNQTQDTGKGRGPVGEGMYSANNWVWGMELYKGEIHTGKPRKRKGFGREMEI